MENFIGLIETFSSSTTKFLIEDDKGKMHEIKDGIKGKIVEIKVNNLDIHRSEEIFNLIFGKFQRVGVKDLQILDDVFTSVKNLVLNNASPASKKKIVEKLK